MPAASPGYARPCIVLCRLRSVTSNTDSLNEVTALKLGHFMNNPAFLSPEGKFKELGLSKFAAWEVVSG